MLTKISHAGFPRRFFKIGTQNTDIAIIKKIPFFQKTVKLRPFSRPARDVAYAEKDTLLPRNFGRWWQHNGSSGTPGLTPGWARLKKATFPQFFLILLDFLSSILNFSQFSSSIWGSGWAGCPPGKALAGALAMPLVSRAKNWPENGGSWTCDCEGATSPSCPCIRILPSNVSSPGP